MDYFNFEWKCRSRASLSARSLVFGVCAADLIPLVLLILGLRICRVSIKPALCFVCWTPICLLSSRSKQSCLQVVHKKDQSKNLLRLVTHFNLYFSQHQAEQRFFIWLLRKYLSITLVLLQRLICNIAVLVGLCTSNTAPWASGRDFIFPSLSLF